MKKVQIIATGSQGSGKTTVLNYFKDLPDSFLTPITEVARNLHKQGVKINEDGDEDGQKMIFDTYVEKLNQNIDYISDRGLTDVIAYTSYLLDTGRITNTELLNKQLDVLEQFAKTHPDIIVAYFPIEFELENDGVRSTDEKFRRSIDNKIKLLVEKYFPNHITVRGTVEERIKQIIEKVDDLLINIYTNELEKPAI